jgi:tripartite-type tricarboxylate transporter receptor subunit TctC
MILFRFARLAPALAVALIALAFAASGAQAAFPDRPIRLIVPYPAGGSSDIVARSFAEYFERAMGQPIVIENVGGAGGYNGAMRVANAAPDGYTLLIGAGSELLIRNLLQPSPVADPIRQYTPISLIGAGPMVLVGKPDIKAADLQAVIALSKGAPTGLNYGSAGHGTFMHLVGEAVKFRTNAKATHVPYKGAAPVMTDVIAGHVDLGVSSLATALPFIKDGKARAFAVTSAERTEFAPDIPTLSELPALKGFSLELWIGLFGPAGLPADVVTKLEQAARTVLDEPELKTKLARAAISVRKLSGAEFKAFLDAENQKYKTIITDSEIKGQ